jgi:hypothetical protein
MPEYRAYIIGRDGHIQNRIDIVCEEESTANNAPSS